MSPSGASPHGPAGSRHDGGITVTVCVATCQRPQGLRALLGSLSALRFPSGRRVDLRVVVVDNTIAGTETRAGDLAQHVRWPLEVIHEPRRGIPYARNAAVAHALERSDYLAFVDDDEVVEPDWLDRLLDGIERHGADVATGPVLPTHPPGTPGWLLRGGFLERDRFETGTARPVAYTGNVLVRAGVLAGLGRLFDESMALTGGTDRELFSRVAQRGHRIVWVDEAEVHERVPPSRATLRWLLWRRFTRATLAAAEVRARSGAAGRENLWQVAAAVLRVLVAPLRVLVALRAGRHVAVSRLRDLALNAGLVAGSLGFRAEEYRRVHGEAGAGRPAGATGRRGPVFVVPFDRSARGGPVAGLVGAAALTLAARDHHGDARLLGPAGPLDPDGVRTAGWHQGAGGAPSRLAARLPLTLKTALKDARRLVRVARRNRSVGGRHLPAPPPAYVWQRHDLGFVAGERLARRAGVPFVLSVHALQVREGARWGTRRPLWGPLLERLAERPVLRRADLVTCVSEEVAAGVRGLGVPGERIAVVPNGVDTDLFAPGRGRARTRATLGIGEGEQVVGWMGSFHRFHGLDVLLDAVARLDGVVLLLVGSGHDLPRIRARARELGLDGRVRFTGAVPHVAVPGYINAMDAAVLVAAEGGYHYSPLKLREYMACGRAVVAPAVGEPGRALADGEDAVLVPPADPGALASALGRVLADAGLRAALGRRARDRAVSDWAWATVLAQQEGALAGIGPSPGRVPGTARQPIGPVRTPPQARRTAHAPQDGARAGVTDQ